MCMSEHRVSPWLAVPSASRSGASSKLEIDGPPFSEEGADNFRSIDECHLSYSSLRTPPPYSSQRSPHHLFGLEAWFLRECPGRACFFTKKKTLFRCIPRVVCFHKIQRSPRGTFAEIFSHLAMVIYHQAASIWDGNHSLLSAERVRYCARASSHMEHYEMSRLCLVYCCSSTLCNLMVCRTVLLMLFCSAPRGYNPPGIRVNEKKRLPPLFDLSPGTVISPKKTMSPPGRFAATITVIFLLSVEPQLQRTSHASQPRPRR